MLYAVCTTGDVWHIALPGCDNSLLYGYRVTGPNQKSNQPSAVGHKFDDVSGLAGSRHFCGVGACVDMGMATRDAKETASSRGSGVVWACEAQQQASASLKMTLLATKQEGAHANCGCGWEVGKTYRPETTSCTSCTVCRHTRNFAGCSLTPPPPLHTPICHPFPPQTQVIIDPYARAVLSRRRYGELGAQLDYERDDVLGLAATWPQAAAFLPKPTVS